MIGTVFNLWTVVGEPSMINGKRRCACRCACGNERVILVTYLVHGKSKSCLSCSGRRHPKRKKGKWPSDRPEYSTWHGMKTRCFNPNAEDFVRYGGRGITVCDRWKDSFHMFMEDMGPKPTPDHSIERLDNDKGYEPGNCKWATLSEQARNKSDSAWVEFNGERLVKADWADRLGISHALFQYRLVNWSFDRAMTTFGLEQAP